MVAWGHVPDELFRVALAVGAESVAAFPGSEAWLVEELTDLGDQRTERGLTLGVVGGSGGVGATTFACALGQMAARSGQAVVIDLDPLGPGIDRVLGLEAREGVRWDELGQPTGRLSARSLRQALPRSAGLGVLTWNAGPHGTLQAFAVREALSAAQRGHDTVVLDLPRCRDDLVGGGGRPLRQGAGRDRSHGRRGGLGRAGVRRVPRPRAARPGGPRLRCGSSRRRPGRRGAGDRGDAGPAGAGREHRPGARAGPLAARAARTDRPPGARHPPERLEPAA